MHMYKVFPLLSGWSEWKVKDKCKCEGDSTTAEQEHVRTCTNPPPILELKGSKCIKNGKCSPILTSEVSKIGRVYILARESLISL